MGVNLKPQTVYVLNVCYNVVMRYLPILLALTACDAAHSTTWYVEDERLVEPMQSALDAWGPASIYEYNIAVGSGAGNEVRVTTGGVDPNIPGSALCIKGASVARSYGGECFGGILVCESILDNPDKLQKTLSHEMGHYLGGEHDDGGVMSRSWRSPPYPTAQNIQAVLERGRQPCE